MINLVNGYPQGCNGLIVPDSSISFALNVDATVIAPPYGFVAAQEVVTFQFNALGQIQPNAPASAAQIYSNLELSPQNANGLGTYYLVTFYDANGARINKNPMWWQFDNPTNATVDISDMVAYQTAGGNVIFYPLLTLGTVTSVTFTGDGTVLSTVPTNPVTITGTLTATLLTQAAHAVLIGPTSGPVAVPTFRAITLTDLPVGIGGNVGGTIVEQTLNTANYPMALTDRFVIVSGSGANSVTLDSSVLAGTIVYVINLVSNALTINATSGTVGVAPPFILYGPGVSSGATLIFDGTNWQCAGTC